MAKSGAEVTAGLPPVSPRSVRDAQTPREMLRGPEGAAN